MVDHTLTFGNCLTDGKEKFWRRKRVPCLNELCFYVFLHYLERLSENHIKESFGDIESVRASEMKASSLRFGHLE